METNSSVRERARAETGGENMEEEVDDKTTGMTPRCRVALLKSRVAFVKDLDIEVLMDHLLSKLKLTQEDREKILARQTRHDQRRAILNLLPSKGQGAYNELVNYLEKHQSFLSEILATTFGSVTEADLGEVSLPPHHESPSPRCRLALQKSEQVLARDLDVNEAVDHLLSELILMPNDGERILARSTSTVQRTALVRLLQEKGLEAYEKLMEYLQDNQQSVWNTVQRNYDTITDDELDTARVPRDIGSARTLQFQAALRTRIRKYLENDPSKLLPKSETSSYISQPITVQKVTGTNAEQLQTMDVFDLLDTCCPGQPLFLYGAAGMGKSTLCRQIAKLWANGDSRLCGKFTYVFPIPMQLVRSRELIDIICDDAKLIPDTSKGPLQEEIDLNTGKVLLLLDSYEELIHTADVDKINELILHEIRKETLVVMLTSRPHPKTEKLEAFVNNRITAQLEDLPEDQIKRYMEEYPNLGTTTKGLLIQKFGIGFLQRPVNLWLCCYAAVTVVGSTMALPQSQVALLNLIAQYILVAFLKKKNITGIDDQLNNKSPLIQQHFPVEYKIMLKEAGKICYNAIKNGSHSIEIGLFSKAELLSFGLFADTGEEGCVVLPNQVLKDYLAALYLSAEEDARNALLKQIRDESLSTSPTPCLVDLLRSLGLDNVILLLVGLLPSTVHHLTELFVVKQSKVRFRFQMANKEWANLKRNCMHSFLHYELNLYQESSDEQAQAAIANGLLSAKVLKPGFTSHRDFVPNRGCHLLLNCFKTDAMQKFLEMYYNCHLRTVEGHSVLMKLFKDRSFLLDSFVVGAIIMHNCQVEMSDVWFRNAYLPVQVLANNMQGVECLTITNSTLCANTTEFVSALSLNNIPTLEIHNSIQQAIGSCETRRPREVGLKSVRGLKHLTTHYTWPGANVLHLELCDLSAQQLRQCFPDVPHLLLFYFDKSFFSKTTLSYVEQLFLQCCETLDLKIIRQRFPGLKILGLMGMTIRISHEQPTWPSLEELSLTKAHVKQGDTSLNLEQANETLAKMCPHSKLVIDHYMDEQEAAAMDQFMTTFSQAYRGDTDEAAN